MPRTSTIDTHPDRAKINAAIIRGVSFRRIAAQYGMSEASVRRHLESRLAERAAETEKALAIRDAEYVWQELDAAGRRIRSVMEACEEQVKALGLADRDGRDTARLLLQAVSEMHSHLELLARIEGKIKERATIVFNSPVLIQFQDILIQATKEFPEVHQRITAKMAELAEAAAG